MSNPKIGQTVEFKDGMEQHGKIITVTASDVTIQYENEEYDEEMDEHINCGTETRSFPIRSLVWEGDAWFARNIY